MKFNIITNISNGVGLENDYRMLRAELESLGHHVCGLHFKDETGCRADVNIFLEIVNSSLFPLARRQWLVPNPEWFFQREHLPAFEKILTKTRDGERIFRAVAPKVTSYIGWKARDMFDQDCDKKNIFLHVAGKSQFKNTRAVIDCWTQLKPPAQLYLVSESFSIHHAHNITCIHRASDDELREMMNMCRFHLMPSSAEGYGHVLHEAFSTRGVVITTNAPPMNEAPATIKIDPIGSKLHNLGTLNFVSSQGVYSAVACALRMSSDERWCAGLDARQYFESANLEFSNNLKTLVGKK
jgi:glycosyltransferase involved in cell wall biosynthesis